MTVGQLLFLLFAVTACGGAVAVVVSQNVVRMAFWLIVSLGATAGLFFLLHADFVAATQLLIYVGGTLVLLIFGVMLTASGPYLRIATSPAALMGAGAIGVFLLLMIFASVRGVEWDIVSQKIEPGFQAGALSQGHNPEAQGNTTRPLGLKLLGVSLEDVGAEPGRLSTGYLLPFEIASVHLLVVLVGAAYLARAKRRADAG